MNDIVDLTDKEVNYIKSCIDKTSDDNIADSNEKSLILTSQILKEIVERVNGIESERI